MMSFLAANKGTLWVVAVVAALGYVQWQRSDAAGSAQAECKADVYAAELADIKVKLEQAKQAADSQRARADETAAKLQQVEVESGTLKEEINRLGNGGSIPPSVRDKLRVILAK